MTIYALKNPDQLKKIITFPDYYPPRMELVFEGFSVISEHDDIKQKIKDIVALKYINSELADTISKEFFCKKPVYSFPFLTNKEFEDRQRLLTGSGKK
ncbi:MAG: hypothetical protein H0T84_11060 [Tatlockia sp.]|nr:hypothetical protein [Tatlockia sp.]